MTATIQQKGPINCKYTQSIGQIDIQKGKMDIEKGFFDRKKGQIDGDIGTKKGQIDIQKGQMDTQKGLLNGKKAKLQNEISTLSEKKIKKQIKVTKLIKEKFEIFESKIIDDEGNEQFIEEKTKFLNSMKKNEKKLFNSHQTITIDSKKKYAITINQFSDNMDNVQRINRIYGTMTTRNGKTLIDGKEFKQSKNEFCYGDKRYLSGQPVDFKHGKVYRNDKELKPLGEEEKSMEDVSKNESEFFVDIGVLEESYKFLMELEKNCEKKPKQNFWEVEDESQIQGKTIKEEEIRIRVPKIEEKETVIQENKTAEDTETHIKEEIIENGGTQKELVKKQQTQNIYIPETIAKVIERDIQNETVIQEKKAEDMGTHMKEEKIENGGTHEELVKKQQTQNIYITDTIAKVIERDNQNETVIQEKKAEDTGTHMKEEKIENGGIQIEKDIQNNKKTNQTGWCSCCKGPGKEETIRITKK